MNLATSGVSQKQRSPLNLRNVATAGAPSLARKIRERHSSRNGVSRIAHHVIRGLRSCCVVRISRASGTLQFPADFLLIACAHPCPCGRQGSECRCGDTQRLRYARRLSAPANCA